MNGGTDTGSVHGALPAPTRPAALAGLPLGPLLAFALVLGAATGCDETAAAGPPPSPARASEVIDPSVPGVTWTHLGSQSAAAFALGPLARTERGLFRPFTLFVHVPGTSEPFACVPGMLRPDDASPVHVGGEVFTLELRPPDGTTWGGVGDEDQLVVTLDGLP